MRIKKKFDFLTIFKNAVNRTTCGRITSIHFQLHWRNHIICWLYKKKSKIVWWQLELVSRVFYRCWLHFAIIWRASWRADSCITHTHLNYMIPQNVACVHVSVWQRKSPRYVFLLFPVRVFLFIHIFYFSEKSYIFHLSVW